MKNKIKKLLVFISLFIVLVFIFNFFLTLIISMGTGISFLESFKRKNFSVENFVNSYPYREISYGLSNKPNLLIFGAGYSYGFELPIEHTLSAQLSKETKRTVINRSIGGGGINHAIIQVQSGLLDKQIKNTDIVIYVFSCPRDTDRLYCYPGPIFQKNFLLSKYIYPIMQKNNNGDLIVKQIKIPLINGSCLYRIIEKIFNNIKYNIIDSKKQAEDMHLYFTSLNRELKKINDNIKLYVLMYYDDEKDFLKYIDGKDYKDIKFLYYRDLTQNFGELHNPPKKETWENLVVALKEKILIN